MWPFSFLRPRLDSLFIYTWTLLLKRDKRAHVQYMPHSCPQHSTPPKKVQCSAIHCNGLRPEKRRAGAACFCKKTIVHPSVCWTVDCSWRAMFQWSTLTTPLHIVLVFVTSASYWWLPVVLLGGRIISTVSWRPMPLTSSGCDSTASNSHLEEIATSKALIPPRRGERSFVRNKTCGGEKWIHSLSQQRLFLRQSLGKT